VLKKKKKRRVCSVFGLSFIWVLLFQACRCPRFWRPPYKRKEIKKEKRKKHSIISETTFKAPISKRSPYLLPRVLGTHRSLPASDEAAARMPALLLWSHPLRFGCPALALPALTLPGRIHFRHVRMLAFLGHTITQTDSAAKALKRSLGHLKARKCLDQKARESSMAHHNLPRGFFCVSVSGKGMKNKGSSSPPPFPLVLNNFNTRYYLVFRLRI
jgi:hypothetical protein